MANGKHKLVSLHILLKYTYIIRLSKILLAMSELTILCERTFVGLQEVLAQLSFIFLLQGVELTLVSVEIVIVLLLSKVSHDFSWRIVEVPGSTLCIEAFSLVTSFLAR